MSWRKEQRRAERGYHHGNLKEALLQAALDLIAQKGAAGFTFADAARMAGVSPAAPYRHFRDRDELISSIAQRGFEQFVRRHRQLAARRIATRKQRCHAVRHRPDVERHHHGRRTRGALRCHCRKPLRGSADDSEGALAGR